MKTIKDYIAGNLSPEEEARATGQLFRENFSPNRKARQQKWASRLAEEHQIVRNTPKPIVRRLAPWLAVAASVLFLIFLAQSWLGTSITFTEQLEISLLDYYGEGNMRKNTETSASEIEGNAQAAYNERQFKRAAQLWGTLATENPDEFSYALFQGLSLLYQQPPQARQAVDVFTAILPKATPRQLEEVQWYLALALLKSDQQQQGTVLLEKIVRKKQWKNEQALLLLQLMKNESY